MTKMNIPISRFFVLLIAGLCLSCSSPELPGPLAPDVAIDMADSTDLSRSDMDMLPAPDLGEPDQGAEEMGPSCERVCGDLSGDGLVTNDDVLLLETFVRGLQDPDDCQRQAGDIDLDGELTIFDVSLLRYMVEGRVVGGCEPCELACGDVNGSGGFTFSDANAVMCFESMREECLEAEGISEEELILTACQFAAGDVKKDGRLDAYDSYVIFMQAATAGRLTGLCDPCPYECGDVTNSGDISMADVIALRAHLDQSQPIDHICSIWAANVTGTRGLSQDDLDRLEAFLDGEAELQCITDTLPQ